MIIYGMFFFYWHAWDMFLCAGHRTCLEGTSPMHVDTWKLENFPMSCLKTGRYEDDSVYSQSDRHFNTNRWGRTFAKPRFLVAGLGWLELNPKGGVVSIGFCGNVHSLSCPKDIHCSFVLDVKSQWMSHAYAKSCPGVFVCRCFIDRLVVPLVPHSKDLHLPILPTTVDTCSYMLVVCPCVPLHVSVSLYVPPHCCPRGSSTFLTANQWDTQGARKTFRRQNLLRLPLPIIDLSYKVPRLQGGGRPCQG